MALSIEHQNLVNVVATKCAKELRAAFPAPKKKSDKARVKTKEDLSKVMSIIDKHHKVVISLVDKTTFKLQVGRANGRFIDHSME